jgi:hypothetical protein
MWLDLKKRAFRVGTPVFLKCTFLEKTLHEDPFGN